MKQLLKNPIIQTIIALIGVGLSIIFYINSTKEALPTYSISSVESLASINDNIPDLKILWKDKKIQELKRLKILIFNNGKQYIDKKNISTTKPIRISLPEDIKLLQYRVIQTSRKNLDFKLSRKGNDIIINIKDDDALEYKDGTVITLLFTGALTKDIVVKGRIKGSKDFVKIKWSNLDTSNNSYFIIFISLISMIIFVMKMLFSDIKRSIANNSYKDMASILFYMSAFFYIFILFYILWDTLINYSYVLSWLN